LCEQLKRQGWISSITAGVTDSDGFDAGTFGAKFDVTMKLTMGGIDQWESIVETVFEYIAMLQSSGLPEWVFEELRALAEISFRFQEEHGAVEQCEELAQIMQVLYTVHVSILANIRGACC
jgi:secreted Zn-dependent insulinase-like peptidase